MFSLLLSVTIAFQTPAPADDYVKMWDSVEKAISGRYYGRTSKKEQMDRLLSKYAPEAKAAKNRDQFSAIVNKMIDDFGDSHFDFFTPADQGYYVMDSLAGGKSEMPHMGAWFKKGSDGYTVQMVMEGSPAAQAGIMKGDLITLIDGKPFTPVESLKDKAGAKVKLKVKHLGKELEKEVEVRKSGAMDMFLDGTRDSVRVIDQGSKKIGYVHLWTMANDQFRTTLQNIVYNQLRDTDALILDIRDGFGGRPEGFGDPFFRPEAMLEWKFGETKMKQLFGYQRPMVLLINGGSRSAKEVFSYLMKKSKRATLMGATTAGHVLGTSPGRLNDWAILEIPMVEVFTDGQTLEGKGVSPDIALREEFSASGEDLYIKEALKHLAGKLR